MPIEVLKLEGKEIKQKSKNVAKEKALIHKGFRYYSTVNLAIIESVRLFGLTGYLLQANES